VSDAVKVPMVASLPIWATASALPVEVATTRWPAASAHPPPPCNPAGSARPATEPV
jgi:hypothetical protein